MTDIGGIAGDRLKALIERIERLEEEKSGLTTDIAEVYAEGKSLGFEVKIMREIVKLRKLAQAERDECDELLNLYMAAIGMQQQPELPLERAADSLRRMAREDGVTIEIEAGGQKARFV